MSDLTATITDLAKEFFEESKARTKSRAIGAFILSWLTVNYQHVATLLFTDDRTPKLVSETLGKMIHMSPVDFSWLMLIWIFWVFARPIIDYFVSLFLHKIEKPWRARQEAAMDENLRMRKKIREREEIDKKYEDEIKRLRTTVESLKEEQSINAVELARRDRKIRAYEVQAKFPADENGDIDLFGLWEDVSNFIFSDLKRTVPSDGESRKRHDVATENLRAAHNEFTSKMKNLFNSRNKVLNEEETALAEDKNARATAENFQALRNFKVKFPT